MYKLIFSISLLFTVACTNSKEVVVQKTPSTPQTVANPPAPDVISVAQLEEGRGLYEKNCAMCHELFVPNRFGEAKWRHEVSDMVPMANSEKNAGISKDQEALILAYLLANCKK